MHFQPQGPTISEMKEILCFCQKYTLNSEQFKLLILFNGIESTMH